MSIEFKTSGLGEFKSALREYELASSKTRVEVLEHRARNFAFALYREALKVGRATVGRIKAIPASNMKVRHNADRTQKQEKARRIFAAGFVASGWIPSIKSFLSSGSVRTLAKVDYPRGSVVINHGAGFIDLINSTPGASEAEDRHGITDKAARNQAEDMRRYLQRKADKDLERAWR